MFERFNATDNQMTISATGLVSLWESPRHYYSSRILREVEETEAMAMGTLLHAAVLEPETFHDRYQVLDDKDTYLQTVAEIRAEIERKGAKVAKGLKDDLVAQLRSLDPMARLWDVYLDNAKKSGKVLVSAKEFAVAERVMAECRKHNFLRDALNGGQREVNAWGQYGEVVVTGRMDYVNLTTRRPFVMDLKKVRTANPRVFARKIYDDGLFIQAAVYVDLVKKITGTEPLFCWAVVEDKAPFSVEVYACDFGTLEAGRAAYHKLLDTFEQCWKKNEWPGYTNGDVVNIAMPHWAFNEIDVYEEGL